MACHPYLLDFVLYAIWCGHCLVCFFLVSLDLYTLALDFNIKTWPIIMSGIISVIIICIILVVSVNIHINN